MSGQRDMIIIIINNKKNKTKKKNISIRSWQAEFVEILSPSS